MTCRLVNAPDLEYRAGPADLRERILARVRDLTTDSVAVAADLRIRVTAELARLSQQEDQLLDLIGDPDWPQDKIAQRMRVVWDERARLTRQLDNAVRRTAPPGPGRPPSGGKRGVQQGALTARYSLGYSYRMPGGSRPRWDIRTTGDVRAWLRELRTTDPDTYRAVNVAIDVLAETGPGLGRPLVDTLRDSEISNLKELRPRSGRDVSIRVLFVFDPWSQAVLLVAGNKAGNWSQWYKSAIPAAESSYQVWLAYERKRREQS